MPYSPPGRPARGRRPLVGAWERLERDHQVGFPDVMIARFGDPAAAGRETLGDEVYERVYEQGFSLDLEGIRTLVSAEGWLDDETVGSSPGLAPQA